MGWLNTITANHSNYLVCDRANTQSVTAGKVVKLHPTTLQCPLQLSEFTISSCSEGRTRDVHSSSLFRLMYMPLSDVSLRRQASMTQAEKFLDPFLLKSDVNLFNHWSGKADVAGCCSAGSVLRWHEVAPVFSVADLYCLKLFLR